MAEENEVEEGAEGTEAPKKDPKKMIIMAVAGVVVLGAAGIGYNMWSHAQAEKKKHQEEEDAKPENMLKKQLEQRKKNEPPKFVKMDELTVNLPGRGGEHYLQVAPVLQTMDAATEKKVEAFMPLIRDKVLMVLSARQMAELATVEGKAMMAKELALVINSIIEPQLTAIFILQQKQGTADVQTLERVGVMPKESSAGDKLSAPAVDAASQFWKITEMDLPVQAVLFDKFVMQ
jgi:flagellar FliL protein